MTATAISFSSPVPRQYETPIASATSTRLAATSVRVTSMPAAAAIIGPPPPRAPRRSAPAATARPASIRTSHSDTRRAWARSWVTQTTSTSSRSRSSSERLLDRPGGLGVERRGRLVEQQHPRVERQRPGEHRPLLLADRELRALALGEARVEPGEVEQALDVGLAPGELGGEADVVGDRALEQRRQLRDEHDLAPQLERVALADVGAAVADRARLGVGEAVEQPQQGRLARSPTGPRRRSRRRGSGR